MPKKRGSRTRAGARRLAEVENKTSDSEMESQTSQEPSVNETQVEVMDESDNSNQTVKVDNNNQVAPAETSAQAESTSDCPTPNSGATLNPTGTSQDNTASDNPARSESDRPSGTEGDVSSDDGFWKQKTSSPIKQSGSRDTPNLRRSTAHVTLTKPAHADLWHPPQVNTPSVPKAGTGDQIIRAPYKPAYQNTQATKSYKKDFPTVAEGIKAKTAARQAARQGQQEIDIFAVPSQGNNPPQPRHGSGPNAAPSASSLERSRSELGLDDTRRGLHGPEMTPAVSAITLAANPNSQPNPASSSVGSGILSVGARRSSDLDETLVGSIPEDYEEQMTARALHLLQPELTKMGVDSLDDVPDYQQQWERLGGETGVSWYEAVINKFQAEEKEMARANKSLCSFWTAAKSDPPRIKSLKNKYTVKSVDQTGGLGVELATSIDNALQVAYEDEYIHLAIQDESLRVPQYAAIWEDAVTLHTGHAEKRVFLPTLGGAPPTGEPEKGEPSKGEPSNPPQSLEEASKCIDFWTELANEPVALLNLKRKYQVIATNHMEGASKQQGRKIEAHQKEGFVQEYLELCKTDSSVKLARYKPLWSRLSKKSKKAEAATAPKLKPLDVTLSYPGDANEGTVAGDPVAKVLKVTYQAWSKKRDPTKPKKGLWSQFVTGRIDLARKNLPKKAQRDELSMKERHFFFVLRQSCPEAGGGHLRDYTQWSSLVAKKWNSPRNGEFQEYVDRYPFAAWNGSTLPEGAQEAPPMEQDEDPELLEEVITVPSDISTDQHEASVHEVDTSTMEEDATDTAAPKAQSRATPSQYSCPLTEEEKVAVRTWLMENHVLAEPPLHADGDYPDNRYTVGTNVDDPASWRKFPSQKGSTTGATVWYPVATPNVPGEGVKSPGFATSVLINVRTDMAIFDGYGTKAVSRELANTIMTYFTLPRLPWVDVSLAGLSFNPAQYRSIPAEDYWGTASIAQGLTQFECHKDMKFRYPPSVYEAQKRRTSYADNVCPFGDAVMDGAPENPRDFPLETATVRDCVQGLCAYKLQKWEYDPAQSTDSRKPVLRDWTGRVAKKNPMAAELQQAGMRGIFGIRQVVPKKEDLPKEIADRIAQSGIANYKVHLDRAGRYSIHYRQTFGDGRKVSKRMNIPAGGSAPFGRCNFQDFIPRWKKYTEHRELVTWWNENANRVDPDDKEKATWGTNLRFWFYGWSSKIDWGIPIWNGDSLDNLTEDKFAEFCIKLDWWWHSGVFPEFPSNVKVRAKVNFWQNMSTLWHAQNNYWKNVSRKRARAASKTREDEDVPTSSAAPSPKRKVTLMPPPASVPKASAPKGTPQATPSPQGTPRASKRTSPAPGGKASYASRTATKEDPEKEKAECLAVINDDEARNYYRLCERNTPTHFPIDIEEARVDGSTDSEGRHHVAYVFLAGEERQRMSATKASIIQKQLQSSLMELICTGSLSVEGPNGIHIMEYSYLEETGCIRIQCANRPTAVWLSTNLKFLVFSDELRLWETDRDTRYRFCFHIPMEQGDFHPDQLIDYIRACNKGTLGWIETPLEGFYPKGPWKACNINTTKANAERIAANGRIFRLAMDYGVITPYGAPMPEPPKRIAERYRHALRRYNELLEQDETNPFSDLLRDNSETMVALSREVSANEPSTATKSVVQLLRDQYGSSAELDEYPTKNLLEYTYNDFKRIYEQEKHRFSGRLAKNPSLEPEKMPPEEERLPRRDVLDNCAKVLKDPHASKDNQLAAANDCTRLLQQELIRARVNAKREANGKNEPQIGALESRAAPKQAEKPALIEGAKRPSFLDEKSDEEEEAVMETSTAANPLPEDDAEMENR